jgi:hypothetical protein
MTMKRLLILSLLLSACAVGHSQTNTLTFTTLNGKSFANLVIVKIEEEGVLFRLPDGAGWDRVPFTNMPKSIQAKFGYDPERAKREHEARLAADLAEKKSDEQAHKESLARAEAARVAELKAQETDSIESHKYLIVIISGADFPKDEKTKDVCLQIAAELNGLNKALEIGISFVKYSDLLTEKVIAIQKIKDLAGVTLPYAFTMHSDAAIEEFKGAKDSWSKKIETESSSMAALYEYWVQEAWSKAGLQVAYCKSIADKNTEVNDRAIDVVAELIEAEQRAVKSGALPRAHTFDPAVYNLPARLIAKKIRSQLIQKPPEVPLVK